MEYELFMHVFYVFSNSGQAICQQSSLFGTLFLLCGWHREWWSCEKN